MGDKLTTQEILDSVAYEAGLSPDLVRPIMKVALDTLVQYIADSIMYGEHVQIDGLGEFYIASHRMATRVGDKSVSMRPAVRFRTSKALRKRIKDFAEFESEP